MSKPFDRCECDHLATDHTDDGAGCCKQEDCCCMVYVWDRDLGGAAVTRSSSTPKQ